MEERLLAENDLANNSDDNDMKMDDANGKMSDTANSGSPLLSTNAAANDGYEPGSGGTNAQTNTNPNVFALQQRNDGIDAAINVLIGDVAKEKDVEGGGGTVEMQPMPMNMPPAPAPMPAPDAS